MVSARAGGEVLGATPLESFQESFDYLKKAETLTTPGMAKLFRGDLQAELRKACSPQGNAEQLEEELVDLKSKRALIQSRMLIVRRSYAEVLATKEKIKPELQAKIDSAPDFLARQETRFSSVDEYVKKAGLCIFRNRMKSEIAKVVDPKTKKNLSKIDQVASCLSVDVIDNKKLAQKSKGTFDAIFKQYANQPSLSEEDCTVLRKTYEVWSSFHEIENSSEFDHEKKIPFYNVNPHNSAYYYWLQEKAKGRIPPEGLSLLHFDTHSDIGHIHSHSARGVLRSVPFTEMGQLLSAAQTGDRDKLKKKIMDMEKKVGKSAPIMIDWIERSSDREILDEIQRNIRESVHHIAQPLVGAAATDITSDITMVLPPWSEEFNQSPIDSNTGKAVKQNLKLVERKSGIHLVYDPKNDPLGIDEKTGGQIVLPVQDNDRVIRDVSFSVGATNAESQTIVDGKPLISWSAEKDRQLPPISSYLKTKKFILDIDLDGFVSEGHGTLVEPVSFARTKKHEKESGEHGSHSSNSETDSRIEVSTLEMGLIKNRVNSFFERLKAAKKEGYSPEVITISDSTILKRAMEGQMDDGLSGGNFTPSCLVFLLNYSVRQKLKELYPVDIKN